MGEEEEVQLPPRRKRVRKSGSSHWSAASPPSPRLVVVGGGIAGVCCAQELARVFSDLTITLVTVGDVLKESSSVMKITNNLEEISVYERRSEFFKIDNPNVHIIDARLERIDTSRHLLHVMDRNMSMKEVGYDRLVLCTGARPSLLIRDHPRVLGLRDMETVHTLCQKLMSARQVVIVGNGGIALELVHALTSLHLIWVVRDSYIGHSFFDASASAFIMPSLTERLNASHTTSTDVGSAFNSDIEHVKSAHDDNNGKKAICQSDLGGGVGPEWLRKSNFKRKLEENRGIRADSVKANGSFLENESELEKDIKCEGSLQMEYGQEVYAIRDTAQKEPCWQLPDDNKTEGIDRRLSSEECIRAEMLLMEHTRSQLNEGTLHSTSSEVDFRYPIYILTTQDKIFGCDYIVSATGVTPNTSYLDDSFSDTDETINDLNTENILQSCGGEILVDEGLQSVSVADVFAAGDCCEIRAFEELSSGIQIEQNLLPQTNRHWFQMKLWSQARSSGIYAAHCVARSVELEMYNNRLQRLCMNDCQSIYGNSMLDMFAHVTHFFDHKVVLLGRFNAQGLGSRLEVCSKDIIMTADGLQIPTAHKSTPHFSEQKSCREENVASSQLEIWTRVTPGREYIKITVLKGRVVGALLIGDTDLEEVFENLIMNAIDISAFGIHILNPELDLEDFFD